MGGITRRLVCLSLLPVLLTACSANAVGLVAALLPSPAESLPSADLPQLARYLPAAVIPAPQLPSQQPDDVMATDEPAPSAEPGEAPPPEIAPVPKMKVALTFDDGPTRGNTEPLLELLASYDARCTFFVIGSRAEAFPDLILAITAGGHTIGNHTYDHKSLKAAGAEVSVRKTNDIVESITGKAPVLLRPPYGAWHKGVAEGFGMRIVLWSVDSRDWELRDGQKAAEIVLRDVREGSIILMHDVKTYSIEGAEIVLRALTERGYEFVPVEELTGYR